MKLKDVFETTYKNALKKTPESINPDILTHSAILVDHLNSETEGALEFGLLCTEASEDALPIWFKHDDNVGVVYLRNSFTEKGYGLMPHFESGYDNYDMKNPEDLSELAEYIVEYAAKELAMRANEQRFNAAVQRWAFARK